MKYLKLQGQSAIPLQKPYFTVGSGAGFDASVAGTSPQIFCTLHREGEKWFVVPGSEKIWVNAKSISRATELSCSDRIEGKHFVAVFFEDPQLESTSSKLSTENFATKCLGVLEELAIELQSPHRISSALGRVLDALVEMAGAETGFLLSETGSSSGWELHASSGRLDDSQSGTLRRRELLSNTILNEAIRKRKPVFVESIVGHPWAEQASILGARLFSIACLPLTVGDRVLGGVYLYTQTPGRSIRNDTLGELRILGTQAALLLASEAEAQRVRREAQQARNPAPSKTLIYDETTAQNPMREVDARITRFAASDLSLLIGGETGTGKELVARELHRRSPRHAGPFVAVNCGAIPPTLIESTLFGHVKGAFTGAHRDGAGKFAQASGGTLFLDEIADLPLDMQVKLLRVLQEKQVEPVGSQTSISVDIRVISATHQNLDAEVAAGRFRKDLYFRLNGASLSVPPLRDRLPDILCLARYFLDRIDPHFRLSESAKEHLTRHSWPGNVRELEQVMLRAAVLSSNGEIRPEDLELSSRLQDAYPAESPHQYEDFGSLKEAQLRFTANYIAKALERFSGNRGRAAAHLGISERTLYRFLSD